MTILTINRVLAVLSVFLLMACSATRQLQEEVAKSALESDHFTGMTVIEAESGKTVLDVQGNKYFTPASNVKLFTLFAAIKVLGDSVPSYDYGIFGDSLVLRGTADPMFLNDSSHQKSIRFLKDSSKKIYLVDEIMDDQIYGPGWSWEDFEMNYMPEKSVMPLYGNTVSIIKSQGNVEVTPSFFADRVFEGEAGSFARERDENQFYVHSSQGNSVRKIPFITSNQLTADLLSEKLEAKVTLLPLEGSKKVLDPFYELPYDSLYTKMIKESDNFIAEQLMLQVGRKVSGKFSSRKGIDFVLDSCLAGIPQRPRWVDGSGLSRYNLFSPRGIAYLLREMYQELPEERLLSYFPIGGVEGTMKGYYQEMPYLWAKSGSLSNNYCLSGYLRTKKGALLIFSIMNNHYQGSSSERKTELVNLLKNLHERM